MDWDKETFRYQGRDIPLGKREEFFHVKGQDPVKKTLYYAGRKPILNDVFTELDFTVSLDWAGFDGISVEGFFHINRAKDYDTFLAGAGAAVGLGPFAPAVLGDLNNDGAVNFADLIDLLGHWSMTHSSADLNFDGSVGFADLLLLLGNWG